MDRDYWTNKLREAEAELDAARTRTQVNEAAKKLQYARAQLRAPEEPAKPAVRRTNRGSAVASS